MDATIVIPTKNGGKLLDEVLTEIDKQYVEELEKYQRYIKERYYC